MTGLGQEALKNILLNPYSSKYLDHIHYIQERDYSSARILKVSLQFIQNTKNLCSGEVVFKYVNVPHYLK